MDQSITASAYRADRPAGPGYCADQFYRFCQLLEQSQQNAPSSTDNPATDAVRFRPHPGMGFPVSELKNVERDAGNPDVPPGAYTFLACTGDGSAAANVAYLDYITQRHDGHDAVMAFLDILTIALSPSITASGANITTRRRLKQVLWMTFPVVCWDSSDWAFPAARTISPRRCPRFWPCSA